MNAAVVHAFDAAPNYTTFAAPVPQEGERLVRVTAAGLHPVVKSLANGTHYGSTGELPFIAGIDGVGRLEDGSRVYFGVARSPFGTFAEQAIAPSRMCIPLPASLDDATCAGIANPALSSWVALSARAKFVAGESVLVLGATGSAGRLAVQIAKRFGARRVIAAARDIAALEELREFGADALVPLCADRDALRAAFRREIGNAGVDVVLDYLWGSPAETLLQAIAQRGLHGSAPRVRFVQVGQSAGSTLVLAASTLRSSGVEILGSGFGSASLEQIRQGIAEFFEAAVKNPFRFEIRTAPLRDVESLWNDREQPARLVFQP
jgi:NADPH:quinone reductase-like Zn-dependent oxidoreductase